jgi:hypothetical protein
MCVRECERARAYTSVCACTCVSVCVCVYKNEGREKCQCNAAVTPLAREPKRSVGLFPAPHSYGYYVKTKPDAQQ